MVSGSIDKLVILSDMRSDDLQRFLYNSPLVARYYDLKDNRLYPHGFRLRDNGSFIQLGRYQGVRLSFNPNNHSPEIINALLPQLTYTTISRVDIAIDYPQDLGRFFWFETTGKRFITPYYNEGKLSGVDFGGGKSILSYHIYNKALQRGISGTLWRVEARLKRPLSRNIIPADLFDKLCAGGKDLFPRQDTHLTRLPRFPNHLKNLSPYKRVLAKRLSMESNDRLLLQPSQALLELMPNLTASLSRFI